MRPHRGVLFLLFSAYAIGILVLSFFPLAIQVPLLLFLIGLSILAIFNFSEREHGRQPRIPLRAWRRVNLAETASVWLGVGVGWMIGFVIV